MFFGGLALRRRLRDSRAAAGQKGASSARNEIEVSTVEVVVENNNNNNMSTRGVKKETSRVPSLFEFYTSSVKISV